MNLISFWNKDKRTPNNPEETSLVIKEHDFQEAKNSLKRYADQAIKDVTLSRVPSTGGLFHLGNHRVTGDELNRVTSQTQDYLISISELNRSLISEFGNVYKAFESLDRDYITGIVAAIKAAEKVRKEELKDRADIKKIIEHLQKSAKIFEQFKSDIEKLKHYKDVDSAWELIEKQTELLNNLIRYKNHLSKLVHLDDIDRLWELADNTSKTSKANAQSIVLIKQALEKQDKYLHDFDEKLNSFDNKQQAFFKDTIQNFSELQNSLNERVVQLGVQQEEALNNLSSEVKKQQRDLEVYIENAEADQKQNFERFEQQYLDSLDKLNDSQADKLEQIELQQSAKLQDIHNSLEDEKKLLNEQIVILTKRIKISLYIAGGASAIAVIQFILNIIGII